MLKSEVNKKIANTPKTPNITAPKKILTDKIVKQNKNNGADCQNRTDDRSLTRRVLYQLS